MDLSLSPEYEAFRDEVASLLANNKDKAPTQNDRGMKNQKRLDWQKWLIEHGLAARTIPQEYGGYGAEPDILKSRIIAEEFARTGLPKGIANQGVSMLVPVQLLGWVPGQLRLLEDHAGDLGVGEEGHLLGRGEGDPELARVLGHVAREEVLRRRARRVPLWELRRVPW